MERTLLARLALSSLCTLQGVATIAIDFNRTHVTNPLWPGHARFHVVWQTLTVALLSIVELVLIWSGRTGGFYLASLLAALSPIAFLMAFATRAQFGGTLSDPNGIPPARVNLLGTVRSVDVNLVAVVVALIALVLLVAIYGP